MHELILQASVKGMSEQSESFEGENFYELVENGISQRTFSWIVCSYRLLYTEPLNNCGENFP